MPLDHLEISCSGEQDQEPPWTFRKIHLRFVVGGKNLTEQALAAIAIWNGGLGIPGAVIGGVLMMCWYTRKHGLNFAEWLDIAAPGIALG